MFSATREGIDVATADITRAELAARIAAFDENVRRRAPAAAIDGDAEALFALLVAPLRARLAGLRELVIVPDRELHSLPFAALFDAKTKRFLIEDVTIRFALTAFVADSSWSRSLTPSLVISDPAAPGWPRLDGSRDEAARIAALHGAAMLSGEDATRVRFAAAAERSALIHFSGHADSDAQHSYGALLLAGAGDSGVFGTTDITRLALAAHPLVVLAACGTFRGDTAHVSGMPSLARAFLIAGARGVVGTMWEIDDDVAGPLFLRFHESLRAGASPAEALREAQLAMLHSADPRLNAPATWAPVALLSSAS